MKIIIILMFITVKYSTLFASNEEDVFSDYCKPGLCKYFGGDGMHSGCRDGILHNGKFQYPPCPDNAEMMTLSEQDKQDILDFHNNQRNYVACGGLYKKYGLAPGCRHGVVTWDKELEKTAFLHTTYCTFAHDKCRNTVNYPFAGQNLGIMTYDAKHLNITAYINTFTYLWYVEHRDTKMDMIDSFYHQDEVMVGHFLTSLNERNNRVGCTCAKFYWNEKKKNAVMLSCNYPTTNIGRSTVYNSCKIPASKCKSGTDSKYKYLCTSNEKYDVSGKLKLSPYDGDGSEQFQCGRQAEMLHLEREGSQEIKKHDKKFKPDEVETEENLVESTTKKTTVTSSEKPGGEDKDVFSDYCKPGLCKYFGGDGMHSGCRDGIPHNGYPPCPDNAELMPLSESDKQDILDFHNNQRNYVACGGLYKKYGLGPGCRHGVVSWDKELEKTAYLHTTYCTFAHDKCRNTVNYPFAGQNLGIKTYNGKHLNTTAYINTFTYLWYVEHRDTKMDMIDSFYHQDKVMVGHFLTSLNELNNRVGCTCAKFYWNEKKKNAVMLSCNYPTTNIGRSTVYNSCKIPASKCKSGTDPKYKYLCSSNEQYDVSGKLKLIPYDGDGSEVYQCGRQAEMLHLERDGAKEIQKHDTNFIPDKTSLEEKPKESVTKIPVIVTTQKPDAVGTTKKPIGTTKKPSIVIVKNI